VVTRQPIARQTDHVAIMPPVCLGGHLLQVVSLSRHALL
jgi:hypothetical protein